MGGRPRRDPGEGALADDGQGAALDDARAAQLASFSDMFCPAMMDAGRVGLMDW